MDSIVGIRGIGTYIPNKKMTARELAELTKIPENIIIEKFGVIEKPIPEEKDTSSYMAVQAALKALEDADVSSSEIDLVIWNGAQHKDYPNWLAGMKVADEIGAFNAWSFDMEAMCGSMMAGLDVAKSMMLTKKRLNRVLLVSGYRNLDFINLEEPSTRFMLDIGAGGAAVLLEKGYNRNVVLSSSFRGDGSFSEDCIIPVLGSAKWPPKEQDLKSLYFKVKDEKSFKQKLSEKTMDNFYAVIKESLSDSDLTVADIDYLAILHFKKSAHTAILGELGLSPEQTTYLDHYGHIGQNDQIISIEEGIRKGKIKDGNNIVMVGAGLGFVWASTVVKWGPYDS